MDGFRNLKKLMIFFTNNSRRGLPIKIITFFILLTFTLNQILLISLASKSYVSTTQLTADYTRNDFVDITIGKAFTLSDLYDIVGNAVVFDSQNNGYFAGYIYLNRDADSNLLLGKLNNFGDLLWRIQWGLLDQNEPLDIIYDEITERLYVTGVTVNTSSSYKDLFLACFNPEDGSEYWHTILAGNDNSLIPNSIAVTDDYIFVSGIRTPIWYLNTIHNIFLDCFHKSNGTHYWSKIYDSSNYFTQPSLSVNEKNEEIFLVYNGRTQISGKSFYHYTIQKLDYNGDLILEVTEIENKYIKINDMKLHNESDTLILVGDFWESANQNQKNSIILRYDLVFTKQYQLIIGENNEDEVILDIVLDSQNNFIFTGYADSDLKNTIVGFIGKYSWNGTEIWASKLESFYSCLFNDVAIDSNDNLLLTGYGQYYYDFFSQRLIVGYTKDSDNDLLSDFFELELGTDPKNPDTDHDGYSDGVEYLAGTDPLKASSNPGTIKFWNYFGLTLALVVIIGFIIVNLFIYSTSDKSNKNGQSPVLKLLSKISIRKKKEKISKQQQK